MTVAAPPARSRPEVDPRLRQRWVETRRHQGRRRLRVFGVLLGLVVVIASSYGVAHSPVLRVRHVRIVGAPAGALSEISSRAGLDRQRLMIDIDCDQMSGLLDRLPWVAGASVVRRWPATLDITVTRRRAVGVVARTPGRPSAGVALVDASGRVLSLRHSAPAGLPLLVTSSRPGAPGTWLHGAGAGQTTTGQTTTGQTTTGQTTTGQTTTGEVLATAAALRGGLAPRISSVTVVAGLLEVHVGATSVVLGDASDLAGKVSSLQTLVAQVDLSRYSGVDLEVPDRPALTGSTEGTSVSTTPGG